MIIVYERIKNKYMEKEFKAGAEHRDGKCEEAIRAAVEYAVNEKQQQIDELVTELKYARRYLNGFEHDVHTIDELIQKHRP